MSERITIRLVDEPSELSTLDHVFRQVWHMDTAIVTPEVMKAVSHAGGYVAGLFADKHMIGGSFGFLADHHGQRALHSHVTGVVSGVRHGGLGRQVKEHQRSWAAEHGIDLITWTFDPLVRRNAWFNVGVLGARVVEYLPNFYGSMVDGINATKVPETSDRALAAWDTTPQSAPAEHNPQPERLIAVATPHDIVALRASDPDAAARWRHTLRTELGEPMIAGAQVVDFTRDGNYLLTTPTTPTTTEGYSS